MDMTPTPEPIELDAEPAAAVAGHKSIADILDDAARLIEPEGAWTQRDIARDASGRGTVTQSINAVRFCAAGAICRQGDSGTEHPAWDFASEFIGRPLSRWNDEPERTQAEVVATLRAAAALAREQGK